MEIARLVSMANNIGSFFEAEPDTAKGAKAVADHLKNFWEPRMRRQILAYLDTGHGEGLSPIVLQALRSFRQELAPRDS